MISELPGCTLERDLSLVGEQRRQGVIAPPWRLEDVAAIDLAAGKIAGLAGDAQLVLGAVVERLQLRVAHRPVRERRVLRDDGCPVALDGMGAGAEIVLVHAPGNGAIMYRATAGLVAVILNWNRQRAHVGIGPP